MDDLGDYPEDGWLISRKISVNTDDLEVYFHFRRHPDVADRGDFKMI